MAAPTLLGKPIVDKCPCGARVRPHHRQQLVMDNNTGKWMRACGECIDKDRTFQ